MERPTFRSEALDRLISPDQLDRLIQITTPQSWLTLFAFGSVVVICLLWGIFGEMVSTVEGAGLLSLHSDTVIVSTAKSGRINEIYVESGQIVETGQRLASVTVVSESGEAQQDEIISPTAGRIISIRTSVNTSVSGGTPLFSIEDLSAVPDELMVITFLTIDEIQQVEPGMLVRLRPVTSNSPIQGYLLGEVSYVASYPASDAEILLGMGDSNLLESNNDLLFEVRISLQRQEDNYVWTVSSDAGFDLISGMAVQITIETSSASPLSRVLKVVS